MIPQTTTPSHLGWAEQMRFGLLLTALAAVLLLSITVAVVIGPVPIPVGQVWRIAWAQLFPSVGDWTQAHVNIVWLIRFPRLLMAVCVGAGLAVVGVTMQAVVRNPLADPYILGISSGASVGAVLVLGLGAFAFAGAYAVSLGAFLFALLTFLLVFLLAQSGGRLSPARLILAGVACSYLFSGLTSFITLTSNNRELANSVLAWLLGSLAGSKWLDLTLPAAVLVVGALYLVLQARSLNALIVGDETAATLGVNVLAFRRRLFLVMSLLTGVMVATSGAIGFVGLMIPHLVRMLIGTDHRRVLPVAALVGSIFLIWVDVLARTAFAPQELPVGVITSLLGGPFFIWLLYTQRKTLREAV
jgi:iron complex transport system permease protein